MVCDFSCSIQNLGHWPTAGEWCVILLNMYQLSVVNSGGSLFFPIIVRARDDL